MRLAEEAGRWPRNLRDFATITCVSDLFIEGTH